MAIIRAGDSSIVLINTFFVAPDRADELMRLVIEATESAMRHQPGFVSANLHMSLDKKRIVNYAQWRSKEDFEAMQSNPAAKPHMKRAAEIAERFEPVLYLVAPVDDRSNLLLEAVLGGCGLRRVDRK